MAVAPWQVVWEVLSTSGTTLEASPTVAYYLTFMGVALGFVGAGLATSALLRKRSGYKGGNSIAYEGGEEPVGTPWVAFHARYYVVALIFLLFEVEIAFMFPYALAYLQADPMLAFVEGSVFVGVLGLGLLFVWLGGWLDWPGTQKQKPQPWEGPVPQEAYKRYYKKPAS